MKNVIKLEELGLLILFSLAYFIYCDGSWGLFLGLFFLPDISFILFFLNKKAGVVAYNIFHHKGVITLLLIAGFYFNILWMAQVGLIFMAHSCFDRMAGYGLKYLDNSDHTHLGWIGKSKHKNN